jgi:Ca2+-binding RTX toxin-like protein
VNGARLAALAGGGIAGVALALVLAAGSGARGDFPPCVANSTATTITEKTYTGTPAAEIIQANDQNNVIYGRGGNDVICAYKGEDTVKGGKGRDDLWGESGSDVLKGGGAADRLRGGGSHDVCKGGKPGGNPDPDNASECEETTGAQR